MLQAPSQEQLAISTGMLATTLFSLVYVPQLYLNMKRQSTEGFSQASMVIKLVGGSFLLVNSIQAGEATPVVLYGTGACVHETLWANAASNHDLASTSMQVSLASPCTLFCSVKSLTMVAPPRQYTTQTRTHVHRHMHTHAYVHTHIQRIRHTPP